ncbi:hypothetical protein [Nitritalea halalkaliphila]|uniref:hypothetical protein n=1 Tax=Nitritalea halalkaliphila TaxID=590849 RepID=UPI00031E08B0|nr:hypothetical protein [Nitritalea halalkaliphila]
MNRFTWDFRRDELPAVEPIFVYGNYNGAAVPPGTYTAKLTYKGQSQETEIQILADPRIEASPADYAAQYALMLQVEEQISALHSHLNEMRAIKGQLQQRLTAMEAAKTDATLLEKQKAMLTAIETWESTLIQPKQETFQDVINFHNQLNSEWMALKAYLDGPYPAVTAGAKKRYQDLSRRMSTALSEELTNLKRQLAALEEEQKQAGLSLFLMPESK